ncbi:hydantoinase/oxoprolinase family protein [Alteromonas aestuariivivens]|uniref:Hydantoinase/oxoprolinase family protein n=1 Tax=Alteromonas aestuariivivens TaxID=1938339 RepID=A0A3D8M9T5_9ALTE|nr:hydantoinase/oxoprolinase family protein [Alteromonas aestuariivivens]RDV26813.1 hydantoinase/oxoprolinase family protein [Alteromonas aestuariivivens]
MRIGIDVGGTHTDAVLLDGDCILATHKSLTTADVESGIMAALSALLQTSKVDKSQIQSIMIGTTQFTNAVVERKELAEVAIIRIALPSGNGFPPLSDWPDDIADAVGRHIYLCHGGYLYDGHPLAPLNDSEIDDIITDIRAKGLTNVAIASAFSSMNPEPEHYVAAKLQAAIPGVNLTLSHRIGSLGLLERENAAILNTALLPFAQRVVEAFHSALREHGFGCPMFISQNDGTLMSADFVKQYPALTFASGPTNSLRGAYKLTGLQDAIVVDIGGTTSDIGVLQNGFPRESNLVVSVGGVRTNFRMPDIQAVGLGGGSLVSEDGNRVGPQSVGHRLVQEGLVFGGSTLTATDIVVAAGLAGVGDPTLVSHLSPALIENARASMQTLIDQNIDMMKPNAEPVPVILVGGGAILIQDGLQAASTLVRPEHAGVANAIGAAIAQVGGEAEALKSYSSNGRQQAIDDVTGEARQRAIAAGADAATIRVADIEETEVPYMEQGVYRLRVKVIGEVATLPGSQSLREQRA